MQTFLGVPILLRGVAYGNLYLTEKAGGEQFTEEDEELDALLAAQAAVAIENARLYESATRWSSQLESLNEVGDALVDRDRAARAARPRRHAPARAGRGAARRRSRCPQRRGELRHRGGRRRRRRGARRRRCSTRRGSKSGRVLERRRSERVDSLLDDPEVDQERHAAARRAHRALRAAARARPRDRRRLAARQGRAATRASPTTDLRLAETFAARAAVAVDLSQRVARDALRRVVDAQELERRRLARELHDETGQALTSILLGLKALEDARGARRT